MKSPKKLPTDLSYAMQKPRHSSLLLWAVLIMVMFSGFLYLGSKVKEQRMTKSSVHSNNLPNNSLQALPEATATESAKSVPLSFDKILTMLKSHQQINPVIYKSQMILKNDVNHDAAQNHDALWQSGQQQLTVVNATVHSGVDLSELTMQSLSTKAPATLYLPPARIMLTQIDNVTMYDVKTGLPSTVQMGLSLTSDQEKSIKAQIEQEFCQSEVLQTSTEDARQHVIALLEAIKLSMVVRVASPVGCQQAAS